VAMVDLPNHDYEPGVAGSSPAGAPVFSWLVVVPLICPREDLYILKLGVAGHPTDRGKDLPSDETV